MNKPKPIAIDLIRIDAGTQFRAAINQDRVTDYAELFDGTKDWPFDSACEVYFDGTQYFLVDGFHRYLGAKRVKRASLSCIVHSGTQRDAIKYALSANARHGLHRSNEDKRKAVTFAINDVEWRRLSNRLIAEMCGVSEFLVRDMVNEERKIREQRAKDQDELTAIQSQSNEKKIGKDGRLTTKPKVDPKPEPKDEPEEEGDHSPSYAQTADYWEDVDDPSEQEPEQAETPQAKPEPSAKELAASLKSIVKQHNAAMMRAIDDLHVVLPNTLCRDMAHKSFRAIHEVVEAWR